MVNNISDSAKIRETKQRTMDAFLELCMEKKIDRISIKELTSRAGVNRSTFYAHFQDIYDLKDQVVHDFAAAMQERIIPIIIDLANGANFREKSYEIIDLYNQYRPRFQAFLVMNRDDQLVDNFKAIALDSLSKRFSAMGVAPPAHLDYILEYLFAGQLALLAKWVSEDGAISVEDLVELVKALNFDGPVHCLFSF
jgi:AcrR family transcriptional regulator